MKRGKIVMKRIENLSNRQVSFSKRKKGLIKKGTELKVLCDATVAVIIYSSNGKLYEYSSTESMESILARYYEDKALELTTIETVASEESQTGMDALKAELEKATSEAKMLHEQVGKLQHELAMKQNSGGEVDTSLRLGLPVDTTLKLGTL